MKESKGPRYLSEYLDEIVEEGRRQPLNGKINWKYILVLLLPFGTLILVALLILKKLNSTKRRKNSVRKKSS
ncbi:hypothetical protein JGI7_01886 [Candidatus Kryptonium thompsonii]|jgi:hypothetical protein|uniref:Uncharacterized protein n=1 Tax=Candidatus Kryptonium thompsonii TaxID=1633631 RepID=A0A0P1MF18_9BACT|nr:hypothetical protein [Candidatus Kryptonium thompsoni]CUS86537.1 hypothetical protein JGI14_102419 [Candidatus Kryptonium thompsoni]CUS89108.1 hypothetical protein JGI8_01274 [Candidatus Kryptonium thompsoni]CUS93845.1 hypothetical protein JGI7_01886 [Candidatus Kryptonium thompsoni]CUS98824.1 hypothetical protein JGI11_00372 [Candidatus Kryptonium thompsoni]CUT02945.1 hypothetical protein JGI17_11654 [Candidatus Kryptonium thompsoni]